MCTKKLYMKMTDNHNNMSSGVTSAFIIGSTRSGTTWLHRMLAELPGVAALPQELSLFSRYIAPLQRAYEKETGPEAHLKQGLPVLVTPAEFTKTLKRATENIYERILQRNPQANFILDKRPDYGKHIALINSLLPNSKFIHIIRDGRDVVVSMLHAHESMGGAFTADAARAAKDWRESVSMAREGGNAIGPERYIEVRYESLVSNTQMELQRLLKFMNLACEPECVQRIAQEFHSSKKLLSKGDQSLNKLREKPNAIWEKRLSLIQRYMVAEAAGGLLAELGYTKDAKWVCQPETKLRLGLILFRERIRKTLHALVTIWRNPVFGK